MKATFAVAAAAAMVGGVSASTIHNRHAHEGFHAQQLEKKAYAAAPVDNSTCGCTTIYSTYYGEATLHNPPPASTSSVAASSSSVAPSSTKPVTTAAPTTSSTPIVVPTPVAQTCPTPGVYTFPATTVTLTETTTVCAASTTSVPAGTHTLGGVTTIVETATTVTCPYATVSTSNGVTTSVIETTTYVCPSAGTYTIAPTTTTVTAPTTVVVPVVSTYCPGTYTQPEVVTTIVETNTVIYCPFDVPATTTAAATTSAAVTVYTTASVVPTTAASTKTSTGSSSTATGLTGNGVAPWAITYTPYDTDGSCKSSSAVAEDIAAIAAYGVSAVRVYSTDCDTLPNVGSACSAHGMKMILGIYIDAAHCTSNNPTVSEQISSIKEWAQWDLVDLIVVANEAIFNGYCSASELASLITECKSEFSGYTGPFTTTDTVGVWQESSTTDALCDVVDIVGAQAHAYFNSETVAADAGTFVRGQLDIVNAVCPGKEARVLETGWPSAGTCNGVACAGEAEQAAAIASLLLEVSQESVFFSLTDDKWKDGNTDCQCEQHWGCSSALGLTGLSL